MHARAHVIALLVFFATMSTTLLNDLQWSDIYALFSQFCTMTTSCTAYALLVVSLTCDTHKFGASMRCRAVDTGVRLDPSGRGS